MDFAAQAHIHNQNLQDRAFWHRPSTNEQPRVTPMLRSLRESTIVRTDPSLPASRAALLRRHTTGSNSVGQSSTQKFR
jgi:hypothetical protein